jgi:hypothetical protein
MVDIKLAWGEQGDFVAARRIMAADVRKFDWHDADGVAWLLAHTFIARLSRVSGV